MWYRVSRFILRSRLPLLILLIISTAFMAYESRNTEFSYSFSRVIPADHPALINYQEFLKRFGEDGNTMVLGIRTARLFDKDVFNEWYELGNKIKQIKGITNVLSIPHSYVLVKNQEEKKFETKPLITAPVSSEAEMDSIREEFLDLTFYEGLIYNPENEATLMVISFDRKLLDTDYRVSMTDEIENFAESFAKKNDIQVHYSGLPFIRSYKTTVISRELKLFLLFSSAMAILILTLLFRSFAAVVFSIVVVAISVVWALGITNLLGYKITLLTGLIPTLIVIIGIPNCVYLLNKYHSEFVKHGNKVKALSRIIERIGYTTFFANLTTAIGFGVFAFTDVRILVEFGIVAGLMITATFIISIITIPIVFSYLPVPKSKHMMHLDRKWTNHVLARIDHFVNRRRKLIYAVSIILVVTAFGGLVQLQSRGYILDDIPKHSKIYQDLKFIEKNFEGIMPFEIMVNTGKEGGAMDLETLKKIDAVQDSLRNDPVFSKALSVVNGLKFATQAYYNGNPKHYRLPESSFTNPEMSFIQAYLKNTTNEGNLTTAFIDSARQIARISVRMEDIGSHRLDSVVNRISKQFNTVFDTAQYTIAYTGTSIVALEGFNYLIKGLISSVVMAFILIAIIMAYIFRSVRMLVIALLPNLIPLLLTAGIMGYFDIPLKPSTVLIFSIAFGMSVDFTIHFLAKYRLELNRHDWNVGKTVSLTIKETGMSMMYTSLILFFGFITFTLSDFGGTKYLGILTSITLVVALFTNLLLLPALLLSFEKSMTRKRLKHLAELERKV